MAKTWRMQRTLGLHLGFIVVLTDGSLNDSILS